MKQNLKTFTVIIFASVILLGSSFQTQGVTLGIYEDGCLVPFATYDNNVNTTLELNINTESPGNRIYWSFMSEQAVQISQGFITIQSNVYSYSFYLNEADGNRYPGIQGFLIFTYDNDGILSTGEDRNILSGNAVLLNLATDDAAFIPVVPLARSDYAATSLDLTNLTGLSITGLSYGSVAMSLKADDCSFWIDPAYAAFTHLVIWTSQDAPPTLNGSAFTVMGDEERLVSIPMVFFRLNVCDVAQDVGGLPAGYVDGIISIGQGGGDRFIFTLIGSEHFGALQTFIATEDPPTGY